MTKIQDYNLLFTSTLLLYIQLLYTLSCLNKGGSSYNFCILKLIEGVKPCKGGLLGTGVINRAFTVFVGVLVIFLGWEKGVEWKFWICKGSTINRMNCLFSKLPGKYHVCVWGCQRFQPSRFGRKTSRFWLPSPGKIFHTFFIFSQFFIWSAPHTFAIIAFNLGETSRFFVSRGWNLWVVLCVFALQTRDWPLLHRTNYCGQSIGYQKPLVKFKLMACEI